MTGFKETVKKPEPVREAVSLTKEEKKRKFLQSAGKIRIDAKAVSDLRERSMI